MKNYVLDGITGILTTAFFLLFLSLSIDCNGQSITQPDDLKPLLINELGKLSTLIFSLIGGVLTAVSLRLIRYINPHLHNRNFRTKRNRL